ncbi:MAG: hypothetical protein ACXWWA_11450 [Chitinophagaceae bacterium]
MARHKKIHSHETLDTSVLHTIIKMKSSPHKNISMDILLMKKLFLPMKNGYPYPQDSSKCE